MEKQITRIVLTGGPAAGKTTLISRILKEFKPDEGWRVITIPETATELISGFGLGPFTGCMSMEDFQYFVIGDQLHKEQLALKGAEIVPQDKILIIYDRAIFDDRAYITKEQFEKVLAFFGKDPDEIMAGYNAVLHLVTCAKGAEFAYNFGNSARYEDIDTARKMDDQTLEAWSSHPKLYVIDNSINFEDKINRAIAQIYRILGQSEPDVNKHKYLIAKPDLGMLKERFGATVIRMVQTYLASSIDNSERRIRRQESGSDYLYFYTEKRIGDDGNKWVTEKPVSFKEYNNYLLERDKNLAPVKKEKYRFVYNSRVVEIDIYPFSNVKAIMFVYGDNSEGIIPPGIDIIKDVTGDPTFKNKCLAQKQIL